MASFRPIMPGDALSGYSHHQMFRGAPLFVSKNEDGDGSPDPDNTSTPWFNEDVEEKPPRPPIHHMKREDRVLQEGGAPVSVRQIDLDNLTEEDQTILDMKDKGFRDEAVAKELRDRGLMAYQPKSIKSRYEKFNKAREQRNIVALDEDLTDWHDGDDEDLEHAMAMFRMKRELELKQAEEKFWSNVASSLHTVQMSRGQRVRFSKHACRMREEGLRDGTANPVYELDPNPLMREQMRFRRLSEIARNKADKMAQLWLEDTAQYHRRLVIESNRLERQRGHVRNELKKRTMQEKNMSDLEKAREMRAWYNLQWQWILSNRSEAEIHDEEKRILHKIECCQMARVQQREVFEKNRQAELDKEKRKAERELEKKQKEDIRRGRGSSITGRDDDNESLAGTPPAEEDPYKKRTGHRRITDFMEENKHSRGVDNPRYKMPIDALRRLIRMRHVEPLQNDKAALVFALAQRDLESDVADLMKILEDRGVRHQGNKNVVMNRLALDDAGMLVGGSEFYQTHLSPYRNYKRSFGSLSPAPESSDGENGTRKPTPRRTYNVIPSDEDESDIENESIEGSADEHGSDESSEDDEGEEEDEEGDDDE